ncbi:hypothetical protein LTS18_003467 [Coniosporium uncinatum]|uniref:Uncharacterized protein n=1 Tax=Coniosporium uncinatum TaxID=93489 RepID=A0ACC3DTN1_9PEZI|nr:hypothetical protein LTS18_003467 [Coniosporium uncinatum]
MAQLTPALRNVQTDPEIKDVVHERGNSVGEAADIYGDLQTAEGLGYFSRGLQSRHIQSIALSGIHRLFLGIGSAFAKAGPLSVPLVYSSTDVAVFAMMQCLDEMATWQPLPGAVPQYCHRYVDPAIGFTIRQQRPEQQSRTTYVGRYLEQGWDQDLFLGIPYAQPPVGGLRFRWPQSLTESFEGQRTATEYGYSCYQYNTAFNLSEDCLTLNIVRPHRPSSTNSNTTTAPLAPVLIWLYGGGLYTGSTADPQYNLSALIHLSQSHSQPIIGVSLNYRLGLWGFLQSPSLLAEHFSTNAGFLDQRMALLWVQENIAAFGGDPARVTVWEESAGAQSLGYHLHSFDGGRRRRRRRRRRRDGSSSSSSSDEKGGEGREEEGKLFRAAILESGSTVGTQVRALAYYAAPFESLTRAVGCGAGATVTGQDRLACLRGLSAEELFVKARGTAVWNPIVDGRFLTADPSTLAREGKFVRVPLLIGANSDEGISFGVKGLETEEEAFENLLAYRAYAISAPTARRLLELYLVDDATNQPPYFLNKNGSNGNQSPLHIPASYGKQWRRHCAIAGDTVVISGRRKMCEQYVRANQTVYSYRFDNPAFDGSALDGAKHFVNVAYSFQNVSGLLGPSPQYDAHRELSRGIGLAYIAFVNGLDPNTAGSGLPRWPAYTIEEPRNLVLNSNGSFVEDDTFRKEGIDFLNTERVARELLA